MADNTVLKTSVEWFSVLPYNGLMNDNLDGWMKDGKRDVHTSYNVEKITEDEFRARLKASNTPVPEDRWVPFVKK
jgi:hypothetical protein